MRGSLVVCVAVALGLWWQVAGPGRPAVAAGRTLFAAQALLIAAVALAATLAGAIATRHGLLLEPEAGVVEAWRAAASTWVGRIGLGQAGLAALALAALATAPTRRAAGPLLVAVLGLQAASGHAVAGEAPGAAPWASVLHVVLAGLWVAGLVALCAGVWLRGHAQDAAFDDAQARTQLQQRLRAWSRVALPGMLLVLASGVVVADWSVARGAALVATPYGQQLMLKLVLVALALACAWRLRHGLAADRATAPPRHRPQAWLQAEALAALGIVLAAGVLAGLVPGAHDPFDWPYPVRLDAAAAWQQRAVEIRPLLLGAGACALAGLLAALLLRRRPRWAGGAGLAGTAGALALALPAISIEAYPTTYRHAPIGYDAASIAEGARLYGQHCAGCHGVRGRGDGPLAAGLKPPPADLGEPHVAWHTHGDLYWWLTHGKAGTAMPGFEAVTTELERWQLLNHLAALSLGHQARGMSGRPAPRDPWLVAIDFRYRAADGTWRQLSEWRGTSAVHLVLLHDPAERGRVEALLRAPRLAGLQLVVVAPPALAATLEPAAGAAVVADADGRIAAAWSHYRRTLDNPDFDDAQPAVPRLEFLIDRHGFVRARWRGDEPPSAPDHDTLGDAVAALAAEPYIREANLHAD